MIRFFRIGRNKTAFFHLVVAEKSKAVQKQYIEKFGYYDPHANKGEGKLEINKERILHFLKNGAKMSQTVARILAKKGISEAEKFIEKRPTKTKPIEPEPSKEISSSEQPVAVPEENN